MAKVQKVNKGNDNIGISDANRKKIVAQLNKVLADETVLYQKYRTFHWNIVGHQFQDLHLFLESEYNLLAIAIDEVAERIRKMGYFPNGTMKQFLSDTSLKEHAGNSPVTVNMLSSLLNDNETILRELRDIIETFEDKYNDVGGVDLLTALLKQHEKSVWMLRATLG